MSPDLGLFIFLMSSIYLTAGGLSAALTEHLTANQRAALGVFWPVALLVMATAGVREFRRDAIDQRLIEKARRRARIEAEYKKIEAELEGEQ